MKRYFARAIEIIRGNIFTSAVGVFCLALALFCAGAILIFFLSIERLIPAFALDSRVVAYLHSDGGPEARESLVREIESWPVVQKVRSVSPEEALEGMEKQLGEWSSVMKGFRDNPLPPSVEIVLKTGTVRSDEYGMFLERLRQQPLVEEIVSGRDWTAQLKPFLEGLAAVGWGINGFFALVALSVLFVAMRLAAASRCDEIELYRIVGATPFHAFFPYYLAGLIEACAGALLAAGLLISCLYGAGTALPFPVAMAFSVRSIELLFAVGGQWSLGVVLTGIAVWLALRAALLAWQDPPGVSREGGWRMKTIL